MPNVAKLAEGFVGLLDPEMDSRRRVEVVSEDYAKIFFLLGDFDSAFCGVELASAAFYTFLGLFSMRCDDDLALGWVG